MTITSLNVVDGTVKKTVLPKFRRPCVLVVIAIIVIGSLAIAYFLGAFTRLEDEVLKPPNPTSALPTSASRLHVFTKSAVCVDNPPCAEIGRNILQKGGGAVDATIGSMICNGVLTMQSMNLGGGFMMTIYRKNENKAYCLNAHGLAPKNAKEEMYGKNAETSKHGPLATAVPGELMGYHEAYMRFGKLPWKELVQPTIDLCNKGFVVTNHQFNSFKKNDILSDHNYKEWFLDSKGNFKKPGETVIPKKLCKTLEIVADKGPLDFYNGSLAKMYIDDLKALGGIMTLEDLASYKARWVEPVSAKLPKDNVLYSMPPPGSGALLAFILNILSGYNFTAGSIEDTNNTVLTYHRIIEAFKYAYARRTELADPNFVNITELLQNLTSKTYADEIRSHISDKNTSLDAKHYGAIFYGKEDHGTAHISVLDENGDAVTVTSSINIFFGSGFTSNQTGIIFNSVMDDFSYPGIENYFGLKPSPNNAMKPGKQPLSSQAPSVIVDQNGDAKIVIGASGGSRITTSIALVIMRTLWFNQNLKEAVDAPRLHHQVFPMIAEYEYGTLQQEVDGLKQLGHKVKRILPGNSIVCALLKTNNTIIGNADYRKGGEVYGIN